MSNGDLRDGDENDYASKHDCFTNDMDGLVADGVGYNDDTDDEDDGGEFQNQYRRRAVRRRRRRRQRQSPGRRHPRLMSIGRRGDGDEDDDNDDDDDEEDTILLQQRVAQEMELALFGDGNEDGQDDDDCDNDRTARPRDTDTGAFDCRSHDFNQINRGPLSFTRNYSLFGDDGGGNDYDSRRNRRLINNINNGGKRKCISTQGQDRLIYSQKAYLNFLGSGETIMITNRQVNYLTYTSIALAVLFILRAMSQIISSTIGSFAVMTITMIWISQEGMDTLAGYSHPLKWIRSIHRSPIKHLASAGAVIGLLQSTWSVIVQPTIVSLGTDMIECLYMSATTSSAENHWLVKRLYIHFLDDRDNHDRALAQCFGTVQGMAIGAVFGIGWRIVLGYTDQSTMVTKFIYHQIWRPLKQYHRLSSATLSKKSSRNSTTPSQQPAQTSVESDYRTRQMNEWRNGQPDACQFLFVPGSLPKSEKEKTQTDITTNPSPSTVRSDEITKCAICLETFVDADDDDDDRISQLQNFDIPPKSESFMLYDIIGHAASDGKTYTRGRFDAEHTVTSAKTSLGRVVVFAAADRYQLMPCNHYFHRDCACEWLTINKTCPVCRVQVQAILGCSSFTKESDSFTS